MTIDTSYIKLKFWRKIKNKKIKLVISNPIINLNDLFQNCFLMKNLFMFGM